MILLKLPDPDKFIKSVLEMNQKEISSDCLISFGKYFPPMNYDLLLEHAVKEPSANFDFVEKYLIQLG